MSDETNRTPLSLSVCKPGDKLLTKHGTILTYVGRNQGFYPHEIRYPNGESGTRCDDGFVFYRNRLEADEDVIAILPSEVKQ